MLFLIGINVSEAQSSYLKRVLIFGPSGSRPLFQNEVAFINQHSSDSSNHGNPFEFLPVDPNINNNTLTMSEVWDETRWINATVSEFQQFDAIIISDGLMAAVNSSFDGVWCVPSYPIRALGRTSSIVRLAPESTNRRRRCCGVRLHC